MKKYKIIILGLILVLMLLAIAVGFYLFFGKQAIENIMGLYNNLGKNVDKFVPTSSQILDEIVKKTDLGNAINGFKKEILAPAPLNVGGKENQIVLTKAKIIAETNIQRYNNGLLPPLIENQKLNSAAKTKADDMFKNQYFEHISLSGIDPGQLIKSYGYDYIVTGENLILGNFKNEKEVVQNWMNSPGHRANILNNRFVDIGLALEKGTYNGQTVWISVQEFGLPLSFCNQPNEDLKNKIDYDKNQLDSISLKMDAKKSEIDNTNYRSLKYNELVDEYNQLVVQYNPLVKETKDIILQYNDQVNIFNQCVAGK